MVDKRVPGSQACARAHGPVRQRNKDAPASSSGGCRHKTLGTSRGGGSLGPAAGSQGNWDAERSQLAEEVDTGSEETKSGQQRDSACPRTPSRAEVDLVDSTSESDTSDPGGMPQLFRGAAGLSACPPKLLCVLPRQPGHEKARREVAVQEAEELPAADTREESLRLELPQVAGTGSSSTEMGDGGAQALAPDQPSGGNDEFARELASAMSTIASLVIKASGRSVSNGGWLYFNGKSKDYCTFRAKCRLFQETYHKATPPPALVKMFGEWNLAEDVACHIEGVEDMPAAWRSWTCFTAPRSR
jgi:hypothetical protein